MHFNEDQTILESASTLPGEARRLGNYELQKFLGEGGMGQVFLGRHQVMRRPCALKILPRSLAGQAAFVRRFRSEAQLMASLSHPHIVGIRNFDHCGGEFFIEMEFIDGGDLQQKIHAHRRGVPPDEVVEILRQILEAVAYAHSQSVIHRDLKPSNILIGKDGDVKIADFGLAAVVGESFQNSLIEKTMTQSRLSSAQDASVSSLSGSNNVNGTLVYMSPQTLRGERPSASDDIYAVGVIAYYMITGRLPSVGYKRPSKIVRGLDKRWDHFISKSLEEDPAARFRTAEEALAALDGIGIRRRRPWMLGMFLLLCGAAAAFALLPEMEPYRDKVRESVEVWLAEPVGTAIAADHGNIEEVTLPVAIIDTPPLPRMDERILSSELRMVLPGGVPMRFVRIPAGSFVMGSPPDELGRESHETQREVTIPAPFFMSETVITQDQYFAIMESRPSYFRTDGGNRPVEQVSFLDVAGEDGFLDRFNRFLEESGHGHYRAYLPSEVEWEYACRAGTTTALSNGRNLESRRGDRELDRIAVYRSVETEPVASREPNPWGLYDMHGNVWEWTAEGVLRGGAFNSEATRLRSAASLRGQRDRRGESDRGFRILVRETR